MTRFVLLAGLLLAAPALAQQPQPGAAPAPAPGDFSLTVYSTADPATFDPQSLARRAQRGNYVRPPGYGVVREVRKIDLKAGKNDVRFTDVASGIDPTTVSFLSLTDPAGTYVVEQNYEYDLVTGDKMLEKYLDRHVDVTRKGSGSEGARVYEGRLLSADYNGLTLLANDGTVHVIRRDEASVIRLAKRDNSLTTKPTLVWKLETQKAGTHDAQVTYQTDSITWRADYNVVLNEKDTAADVGAWVTLVNQSGASYPEAKLKLVAGDVHRLPRDDDNDYYRAGGLFGGGRGGGGREEEGFKEKSFFEYHLYTLGRPTTIAQNATKQIELFPPRSSVPVQKQFVYYGLAEKYRYLILQHPETDRDVREQMNTKVDIYVGMHNSKKNGMGIPLPAGRVRVFKRDDADKSLEFVGEDVIQHTAKDEHSLFRIGSAFDIVGERRQTNFTDDVGERWMEESFEIKLRNHKAEAVSVIVKENLFRWFNWEIKQSSDKWEKKDYRTIHIPVEAAPDGEKVVTYTVRYTW